MVIILKRVRLAFPDLFEPTAFEDGGKRRYGANFLVEPDSENDKLIRSTILQVVKEAFPDEKKAKAFLASVSGQSNKFCYLDGNTKSYDGFEGNWFVSTHRNEDQGPPAVVDRVKGPDGKLITLTQNSGRPYAGCYVNGKIDTWLQQGKYPGVRASLLAVQFVEDGDAFAGAPATPDGFDDLGTDDESAEGNGSEFF